MVAVYIYIDELISSILTPVAHRITLFKDEKISITSSVQNFNDIGKLYTDYSQSFTIPANATNNKIFKYWYENSLDDGFDHRVKYYGYIEIDTIPFRYGKFQLEKAKVTDGNVENYTVTFIGNLVQLKDKFKEDKLNTLSYLDVDGIRQSFYDELNHDFNLSEIEDRITTDSFDVAYPLIGSDRKFYYDEGTAAEDITQTAGAINYNELFPAIPVSKILEYIQACYGVTFESVFMESLTFTKLYLYCKNKEVFKIQTEPLLIDFDSKDTTVSFYSSSGTLLGTRATTFEALNLTTDILTFDVSYEEPLTPPWTEGIIAPNDIRSRSVGLTVTPSSSDLYSVFVYNNGLLYSTFTGLSGTQTLRIYLGFFGPLSIFDNATYSFSFKLSSENPFSFTTELIKTIRFTAQSFGLGGPGEKIQTLVYSGYSSSQTTTSRINIKDFIPDITVEAFFTGLIKVFNLVVYPTGENSFGVKPLEQYYDEGRVIDITDLVSKESIEISKPKLFKKVDFKYEKSDNILNNAFRGLFNTEYGDLFFDNTNSSYAESYEIKTPFEDVLYERTTGGNFLTASMLDKDLQPYIPKPVLMYRNGLETVTPNIKLKDTGTTDDLSQYLRFSNEIYLAGTDLNYYQTLNFGAEISPWNLTTSFVGLYKKFYSNYFENIYNLKTRVITVKDNLTPFLLTSLRLNDRLILQNKRYIINTMTVTDLNTRDTTMELLTDYRNLEGGDEVLRASNIGILRIDNTEQEIELQIYLNNNDLWRGKLATGFLASSYTYGVNMYKDGLLIVSVPANITGFERYDSVLIEYYLESVSVTKEIPIYQDA